MVYYNVHGGMRVFKLCWHCPDVITGTVHRLWFIPDLLRGTLSHLLGRYNK